MKKGRKHSEEWKRMMSIKMKGKKHKPMSLEGRENIRRAHLGYKVKEDTKKKLSKALKGHKCPEHVKKILSDIHKGSKNLQWKGGRCTENEKARDSVQYRLWREAVFARDNWICQKTGVKGGKLHPHHIKNFSSHIELRFAIDNGITLSKESHEEFHRIYGSKNNSLQQLEEFLGRNI
jgi:hypothetical protein